MLLSEIINTLENFAPLGYQESYDNSGLIIGNPSLEVTNALICLDSTEEIIQEAIECGCNLVIAHHPIIYSGLKKITGKNYVERTVLKAIKNDIAIYAMHTNLDNVKLGVNNKIAEILSLTNLQILRPKENDLKKLVVFCPKENEMQLRLALGDAGAGGIGNYDYCSFVTEGKGLFRANENAKPYVGEIGEIHSEAEARIEVIFPKNLQAKILDAVRKNHPYEEVAFDIYSIENQNFQVGSGMIGELKKELSESEFLEVLKDRLNSNCIRHTNLIGRKVKKIALCGGSGSFLLKDAISAGADFYVTADFKYHEFFDAEKKLVIADIGHYESERFTKELLRDLLIKKIPTFAPLLSNVDTNPVNYF